MTLKDLLGYLFCGAGIALFIATWLTSLGWGWAVLAVFLYFIGWCLLRSERRSVAESVGDVVETVVDAIDLD
jgi:predicted tellurium resistance membrane protein TerC